MRRATLPFLTAAVLMATAAPALAKPADPAEVAAAERAFAADGYATGIKASFLKHSAPDAIILAPGPVNAHQSLNAGPDGKPTDPKLEWWPVMAGVSKSGDLGYTTGPYAFGGKRRGYYFTVWQRQASGGWKWIFDGGAPADAAPAPGPDGPVAYLPIATVASGSATSAMAEVGLLEARLARTAKTDLLAAYQAVLGPGSRLQGSPNPPATEPVGFEKDLAWRGSAMQMSPLGGRASSAGDMVWTYGEARWEKDAKPGQGHYVRIWQKYPDGWRLVFDELVVTPPPPPTKS